MNDGGAAADAAEDAARARNESAAATVEARENGRPAGSVWEVFRAFLLLGLTSFGGPIAHLGYFRTEFVERRRWLAEQTYADLLALCQFLPGPASSQVGFALGLMRAGAPGALAAFVAFTLPSALLLMGFAMGAAVLDGPAGQGLVSGLKVVAVAIVAHAVWGMARNLCPDRERAAIAVLALLVVMTISGPLGTVGAIVVGALAGLVWCRASRAPSVVDLHLPVSRGFAWTCLALFAVLLIGLPILVAGGTGQGMALFDAFYRSGALVFGGGHVVLPLLQAEVVQTGWISEDAFLTGYGAAQAIPGPLFTFSAYLGTIMGLAPDGVAGAVIALSAVFLPGFLLLLAVLPFWNSLRRQAGMQSVMRGANAAVVGILGAALYDPVWTSAILSGREFVLAVVGFVLLAAWKMPPWVVVLVVGLGGLVTSLM
ncbi:MAG: chromate efflux transporter [Pseudomonadota bacterium]